MTMVIIFLIVRASGDPVSVLLPDTAGPETRAAVAEELGVDKPLPIQLWNYTSLVVRGDFGNSFRSGRPVVDIIVERVPATLFLAAVASAITFLTAIPLGVLAAIRRGTWIDGLIRGSAFLGQSLPNFWVGILLILIFAVQLGILPAAGRTEWSGVVLPAVTMSLFAVAGTIRVLRSSMLENLRSDYVTTAVSKGLPRSRVIRLHVFRNALIPTVTFLGVAIVQLFVSGSIVVETVFAWPGVGRLLFDAILARDFPVVQAITILLAAAYVFINLAVDLLYGWLDPRIRR